MNIFKLKEREYAVERASLLKKKYPESAHILEFYRHVLEFQKDLYEKIKDPTWEKHMRELYRLLELCIDHGSQELSEFVKDMLSVEREELIRKIKEFLREKTAPAMERFIYLSFLNPFYSKLAESLEFDRYQWLKNRCPVCGFKPSVSYLADEEEYQNARFLSCVLCNTDWFFNRTKCVRCGCSDDDKLDYFYDENNRSVMLQVCRECGTYIKLIDMRLDGLAIPYVDDVASLSLDLWAQEMGFERFEKNPFNV